MEKMTREEILAAIEALSDASTALTLKTNRIDLALGKAIHENCMAWRTLVLQASDIEIDGLEMLKRHLEQTGE